MMSSLMTMLWFFLRDKTSTASPPWQLSCRLSLRESSATFAERKATIRHLLICRYERDHFIRAQSDLG